MSKDYKLYHRYLSERRLKESSTTATYSEATGSGEMPMNTTTPEIPINQVYTVKEMTASEVEQIFKAKYPLHYLKVRKKFDKKLKKLLDANDEEVYGQS